MTDESPTDDSPDPAAYDHLLLPDADAAVDADPGIYRVVGTGDLLALLRVGDADGRRVNTGRVVAVDRDALAAFDPAENPDGSRPASERLAGAADSLAWQVRAFPAGLRARPLDALAALAILGAGFLEAGQIPGPWWVSVALNLAGVVAMVYIFSRVW